MTSFQDIPNELLYEIEFQFKLELNSIKITSNQKLSKQKL